MTSVPDDRSEWRARAAEAAIDPELPVCDPHHHLWEYPESRFLVDDFLAETGGGHRLERTVFVECLMFHRTSGPEALRPVGETVHVDAITAATQNTACRVAAGIVGLADLRLGSAVREVLEAHLAASPRFRGIRFGTAWDAGDKLHHAHTKPSEGLMGERVFREGVAQVAALGLSFDAWMYFPQLPEVVDLARAHPELTIVLDHAGGPIGIGPYAGRRAEVYEVWQRNMREVATCPNIVVKLGGMAMTMAGFGWHKHENPPSSIELADSMRPYFLRCIDLFGVRRCMFESNFPMDRVSCSYTVLWNAYKRVIADFSLADKRALLHDNAARVYRLAY